MAAVLLLALGLQPALAQDVPQNWFNLDPQTDGVPGISVEKAHEALKNKTGQTVVVAILDSGVDIEHEDLKDIVWTNEDEIPNNGKDDDNNGYVDDMHGWNFIGGKDGRNIHHENLEVVRLYNRYKQQFEGREESSITSQERADYEKFKQYKEEIENKRAELEPNYQLYSGVMASFEALAEAIGKEPADITDNDLKNVKGSEQLRQVAKQASAMIQQTGGSFGDIYNELKGGYDYFSSQYDYNWNPEFDARDIVGDDPSNLNDRNYGNNDVEGPDASHGTHVAGIVAAIRGNGVGIDGVASNVRIMSVRVVPDGDERDKDVANAIRYAVDNGAQVINMSFGKGYSPYKGAVDDAVRYAMKRDVLLVHGSGNDGKEVSLENNFPNDKFQRKGLFKPAYAKNWIEVGASTPSNDASLAADFSNYSPTLVDVFAPGVDIYSTTPNNEYASFQGTSMASPMVAGLAAMLRSYFPTLTAEQVKTIIMDSTVPVEQRVIRPGEGDEVTFSRLAVTGGLVNAKKAVELAERTKGKKKVRRQTAKPDQV